jgi:hypothetical protein
MDVRIGSIDTTVVDSGAPAGGADRAQVERIARRVLAMIDQRERSNERAKKDRDVSSPDQDDVEDYG